MTFMHRLGVGSLARTCDLMLDAKLLNRDCVSISKTTMTLNGDIKSLLKKIYAYAFQLDGGILYMPAMFNERPSDDVLFELQNRLLRTALLNTHKDLVVSEKAEENSKEKVIRQTIHVLASRDDGESMTIPVRTTSIGKLKIHNPDRVDSFFAMEGRGKTRKLSDQLAKSVPVLKYNMPGVMTTHAAFGDGRYSISTAPHLAIALDFVLAGVIPVCWHRRMDTKESRYYATILYPEVVDLQVYIRNRPRLTPQKYTELVANSPQEAVAKMILKSRNRPVAKMSNIYAITLEKVGWSGTQINCTNVESLNLFMVDYDFDLMQAVESDFPIRAYKRKPKTEARRKVSETKKPEEKEQSEGFYIVPPLHTHLISNIFAGEKWYRGIFRLAQVYNEDFARIIGYGMGFDSKTSRGLGNMIQRTQDFEVEQKVISAIHFYKRAMFASRVDEFGLKKGSAIPDEVKNRINIRVRKQIESDIHEIRRMSSPEQLRSFLGRVITEFSTNPAASGATDAFLKFYNSTDPEYMRDILLLGYASTPPKDPLEEGVDEKAAEDAGKA